jgi:hypothetical protein
MALPAIDDVIMSQTGNSYIDLPFASDYFDGHMSTVKQAAWAALSDAQQTMAILTSCQDIESLKFVEPQMDYALLPHLDPITLTYRNVTDAVVKWNPLQRLQFPRNIDVFFGANAPFIPLAVQMAQCEQAFFRTIVDTSNLVTQRSGVKHESFTADGISINQIFSGQGDMFAPEAIQLLRQFFLPSSRRFQRA